MRVAVVGGGIVGLSAGRFLAGRGHDVTLYEQFSVGNKLGSSHGHSRIVRKSYPDAYYTELMLDGYPMWHELQQQSGRKLLHECGLLHFGPEGSPNLVDAIDGLRSLNVPHRILGPWDVADVFPTLRLGANEIGVYTPEAGWVDAELALLASAELFRAAGGTIREGSRVERDELDDRYDRFVVAAGGWVREFVSAPVRVTVQTFGYVATSRIEGPVWIQESPELFYGFPSEPGRFEIKIGVHRDGPDADLAATDRQPDPVDIAAIRAEAARRFGIENPVVAAQTCLYSNTESEDFLFGRVGENGFYASACSGHGFKFGPWSGRLLADFVEGKARPEDYPRFSGDKGK